MIITMSNVENYEEPNENLRINVIAHHTSCNVFEEVKELFELDVNVTVCCQIQ